MGLEKKKVFDYLKINLPVVVLIVLFVTIIILISIYYCFDFPDKTSSIISGLLVGLIIVIIQFMFNLSEYRAYSKILNLGVSQVLSTREDRSFYHSLIEQSQEKIEIMGVTASRFMEDFANQEGEENSKVLLQALARGVGVKILVPKKEYLSEQDKIKHDRAQNFFEKVQNTYSDSFAVKYYNHEPAHSILVIDEECIIGPIFPSVQSKFTPAIKINTKSKFTEKYLAYFEDEWSLADEAN